MAKHPPEPTFADLQSEYQTLLSTAKIRNSFQASAREAAKAIMDAKPRYDKISGLTNVPWFWIGITHHMEAGGNFHRHLHCGDPLTARTVHEPKGRPINGTPVFTFEESACDALLMHGLDKVKSWSLPYLAYAWERYNGWGYRWYHPNTLSAYLWSGTQHYSSGKYVADKVWDDAAVSRQLGCIAMLKALLEIDPGLFEALEDVANGDVPPLPPEAEPLPPPSPTTPDSFPKAHEDPPKSWWREKWKHLLGTLGLGSLAGGEVVHPALPTADQFFSATQTYGGQVKTILTNGLVWPALIIGIAYLVLGHVLPSLIGGSNGNSD